MSSSFYPQGMNSYNNRLPHGGYESWKGKGLFSNPVGITSGNMRPLTNKDPLNDAVYKFGLPRPLKWQYRKGISIPVPLPKTEENNLLYGEADTYYYSNREVKTSVPERLVAQLMDQPGRFIVKENRITEISGNSKLDIDCKSCKGIGIVSGWYPINNLSEKPEPNVTNPLLCCNQQRKAIRRVLPANTNLPKNYYTTNFQYLFNRCQTFDQRAFNFLKGVRDPKTLQVFDDYPFVTKALLANSKPGDPLAIDNLYVANCNPNGEISLAADIEIIDRIVFILFNENIINEEQYKNYKSLYILTIPGLFDFLNTLPEAVRENTILIATEILYNPYTGALVQGPSNPKGCKLVEYKPNNPQYAKQGAVSSSTRILKLNVTTIEKNAASFKKNQAIDVLNSAASSPAIPFIYKTKVPPCARGYYIKDGNPKTCFKRSDDVTINTQDPSYSFGNIVNQLSAMTSVVNVSQADRYGF
jgi:hypothetical protein